jgi:glycosyltransferase involved in cell wall biosynthesis
VNGLAASKVGEMRSRASVSLPADSVSPLNGPELSIVVPAFEEADNLPELYRQLKAVLGNLTWELVFADDGSRDHTWREICLLHATDPRVRGIRLVRNFGHQFALLAGIAHASGRAVVTMDADLQHPPAVIESMIRLWRHGHKVVQTIRHDDDEVPWRKRWTSRLFYRVHGFLSGVEMREGMADFRLLDREVVDVLLQLPEAGLFLRGLIQWLDFPTTYVAYKVQPRRAGRSKYSVAKMLALAWDGISSFSIVPLRLGIVFGLVTGGLAILELGYVVAVRALSDAVVPGWASAIGVTSLLFAMLFFMLGVMGEYIGRILIEVRGRPRFVVAEGVGLELHRLDPCRLGERGYASRSAGRPASANPAPPPQYQAAASGH